MKKQKKATSAKKSEKGLTIQCQPDETEDQAIARTMLSPAAQSAWTLKEYINSPIELGLTALMDSLEKQVDLVKNGNLDSIEQMLLVQAHTLDAIANSLFRRSKNQSYLPQLEAYMKLGLKAQGQSRSNLETLVNMKRPRAELIKQTNIAHGHQQVNNFPEKQNRPNELLEKTDGERLDTGALSEAIDGDTQLETVAAEHRAKDKFGQK